jgi:hypothetical protein
VLAALSAAATGAAVTAINNKNRHVRFMSRHQYLAGIRSSITHNRGTIGQEPLIWINISPARPEQPQGELA